MYNLELKVITHTNNQLLTALIVEVDSVQTWLLTTIVLPITLSSFLPYICFFSHF